MTQDEIIEMARQAAAVYGHTFKEIPSPETVEFITSFYKLVAEHERDACALIADQISNNTTIHVLEKYSASEIAKSIRARG